MKPGDVVILKSGGPKMTVSSAQSWAGGDLIECMWFEDANLKQGNFCTSSLELVGS